MTQEWKKVEKLLTPEQLDGKCKLFAIVTIQPGHELANHQHIGETETYYILSGKGIYDDDGTKIPAEANDCFSVMMDIATELYAQAKNHLFSLR